MVYSVGVIRFDFHIQCRGFFLLALTFVIISKQKPRVGSDLILTVIKLSDILSDMKKTVSVAEFIKTFGKLSAALAPGETVQVTAHGKPVGRFIREGGRQRRRNFDIGQRLQQETYSECDGQRLIDSIVELA